MGQVIGKVDLRDQRFQAALQRQRHGQRGLFPFFAAALFQPSAEYIAGKRDLEL